MSYETRDQQTKRDEEYQSLRNQKPNLQTKVSNWIDKSNSLEADSPLQSDKDDIIALRDAFILSLSNTLGV